MEPQLVPLLPDRGLKGWLWRVPLVTKVTVLQILLTPVTMGITLGYLLFSRLELTWPGVMLAAVWLLLGRGIRGYLPPAPAPAEILLLPLLAAGRDHDRAARSSSTRS